MKMMSKKHETLVFLLLMIGSSVISMEKPALSKDPHKDLRNRSNELWYAKNSLKLLKKAAEEDKDWLKESYWALLSPDLFRYITDFNADEIDKEQHMTRKRINKFMMMHLNPDT